jgi:hypothetical protein
MVSEKVIVVLLIAAIVFSVASTLLNLSVINFDFKPVQLNIPSSVAQGDTNGNVHLSIESNTAGANR